MRVTNSQAINAYGALQQIAPSISDTVVRFRISQAVRTLEPLTQSWEEARKHIVEKYAERNEDGSVKTENNLIVWIDGVADDATKEFAELGAIENDLSITKIKLSRLAESLKTAIDYGVITSIDWLIEDDMP